MIYLLNPEDYEDDQFQASSSQIESVSGLELRQLRDSEIYKNIPVAGDTQDNDTPLVPALDREYFSTKRNSQETSMLLKSCSILSLLIVHLSMKYVRVAMGRANGCAATTIIRKCARITVTIDPVCLGRRMKVAPT